MRDWIRLRDVPLRSDTAARSTERDDPARTNPDETWLLTSTDTGIPGPTRPEDAQ